MREIEHEARLLFALLDAAECDGRISEPLFRSRWQELKARIESGASYEAEAMDFHALIADIRLSGALRGTWIEQRWLAAERRIRACS